MIYAKTIPIVLACSVAYGTVASLRHENTLVLFRCERIQLFKLSFAFNRIAAGGVLIFLSSHGVYRGIGKRKQGKNEHTVFPV
jgi:hypothetical protein